MSEKFKGNYEEILDQLEEFDEDDSVEMTVAQAKILVQAAILVKKLQGPTDLN
jgi:hypothetical protein